VIDIKQHIGAVLYERDSLIIPNLGGFVSKYQPATIDHVQGLINPPSKKLQFNKNLIINDGVLIAYLQNTLGLSVKEAKKTIEDFVDRTCEMLNNREIVLFPGVGRLYKDYENNLQFLQDNTNYNTNAYGLPTLQFYPILRSRPATGHFASDLDQGQPAAARSYNYRRAANAIIPIVMIAIITIGALIYANSNQSVGDTEVQPLPIAENRINQKPSTVEQMSILDGITQQFQELPSTTEGEEVINDKVLYEEPTQTEGASLSPEFKECVIIIGAFSKKAGVEKRVGDIVELGYSVYQDKKGKLTRVGIQFAYQHDIEIREKLEAMRDHFDNRAWVLAE
jgi:hypothetical protein